LKAIPFQTREAGQFFQKSVYRTGGRPPSPFQPESASEISGGFSDRYLVILATALALGI